MRQVNPPRPPPPHSRSGGTGTWRRGCNCPRRFGRREQGGEAAGCGGGLGAGRGGARRGGRWWSGSVPSAARSARGAAPRLLFPFTLSHPSCRERPVPAEPSLRGHVEAPSVGRRWCASPPGTGCCCCTERTAYRGAGGGGGVCEDSRSILPCLFKGSNGDRGR